jgi:hypothetical protein
MFQLIRFPADALPDIQALVQLSVGQLTTLAGLLDSKEAVPPIEQEFADRVAGELSLDLETAEAVIEVCQALQETDLDDEKASKVVEDIEQLIRTESPPDSDRLLGLIHEKRAELEQVVRRKPAFTRELRRRDVAAGMQPAISSIRTLVSLHPLFERNLEAEPVGIECLIPVMTLELKYKRDDNVRSIAFSLSEESLAELIDSLIDARAKWDLIKHNFSENLCE